MTFEEMRDKFFPYFENWIDLLVGQKGPSLPVTKHRIVATLIGAAYKKQVEVKGITPQQWTNMVEFVRRPQDLAKTIGCEWPLSKGRWDGLRGYRAQMKAAHTIVAKISDAGTTT
jgi:hypothetical protein